MDSTPKALWIDGRWLDGEGESVPVINPATGAPIATLRLASARQIVQAIDGAQRAFLEWRREPAAARGDLLLRLATGLLARRQDLASLLTSEQGKPVTQALAEVDYAASFFRWFGEEARRSYGRIQPHPLPGREYLIRTAPAGVAALVTPWNFPLAQGAKKIAAALAAGCAAVWKPSEETPLIALTLGPMMREAGFPDGVLQIVPARGPLAGEAFSADPRIRVISATGSTRTGQALMAAAAAHLPRLALELGGNAPFIVLPDADLDRAAADLVKLKLLCSGQVCVTANRVFLPADLEDAFAERLSALWGRLSIGNGADREVDAGPLIHVQACERVAGLVRSALEQGAVIAAENRSFSRVETNRRGSFSPALILRQVRDEMAIAREEIFGPIASLLSYAEVGEAVRRANATPSGLAAYVYGRDIGRANAVAAALEAGIVGVNEWRPLRAEIPFGGGKESGFGHEGGPEGLAEFRSLKVISTEQDFNV